jgi:hypothetical protein
VLAAALDVGTALGVIMIFICTTIPEKSIDWAGNNIWQKSAFVPHALQVLY